MHNYQQVFIELKGGRAMFLGVWYESNFDELCMCGGSMDRIILVNIEESSN